LDIFLFVSLDVMDTISIRAQTPCRRELKSQKQHRKAKSGLHLLH